MTPIGRKTTCRFLYIQKSKQNCETFLNTYKIQKICKKDDNVRYVIIRKNPDNLGYTVFHKNLKF